MMKILKNHTLLLIVSVSVFASSITPAQAFSSKVNPITFLQNTANIILGRVSDLVYFLIMQKRYTFNDYADPNNYISLDIPAGVDEIIASSTTAKPASSTKQIVSNKPISVTTSTLPNVQKTTPPKATIVQTQVAPTIPVLIAPPSLAPQIIKEPVSMNRDNYEILNFTNEERTGSSLNPLTANTALNTIASLRADDLFENQYFEHESPDGKSTSDLAVKVGYDYISIGENLALGNFGGNQGIVSAWMDSPGHKANILNDKYEELGVAVKEGIFDGKRTTIAVQIFAKPLSDCPVPSKETKDLISKSASSIKEMQEQAKIMYATLDTLKNNPEVERSYYGQKIQEYNYFAKKINDATDALKGIIDSYNAGVAKYNACLDS
jgi:uncharacterized protein YkwD